MNSLTLTYLRTLPATLALLQRVGAIEHARGKQELYRTQTPDLLDALQTIATIESTESSNRLEGSTAPRERIEAVVLKSTEPRDRSESEIAGYRDALRMIHEDGEHIRFSENTVRQLHQLLYRYLPQPGGAYKSTHNDIVERNPDGSVHRVRFSPLSPVQTPGAMHDLIERYHTARDAGEVPPLYLVALTVLDFLCIHPFADGNGRTALLLTLLLLYHHDYQVGRYISLERVIEESRETYYETLEASSEGWHQGKHDALPWLDYFLGMLTAAYKEFEERVRGVRGERGTKAGMVRTAIARRHAPFRISDIERELPEVSREYIRKVLRQLREEGRVRLEGRGRGSTYIPLTT